MAIICWMDRDGNYGRELVADWLFVPRSYPGRNRIRLYQPDSAAAKIADQFRIVRPIHLSRPDYSGAIDVSGIVDPIVERSVGRCIAHDGQLPSRIACDLRRDLSARKAEWLRSVPH